MALQEEEYILKWNDHKSNFFSLMAEDLFQQELLTDLTVCCGDTLFNAHRLVLSVCSPYFRHMLTTAPPGRYPIIFLNNIHPTDFERLLQFMYYGEVRIPNGDLEPLLRTATSLKIKGLSAHSGQDVSSHFGLRSPNHQHQVSKDHQPPKKRRISSDADDRRLSPTSATSNPPLAFTYDNVQHAANTYRTDSSRASPTRSHSPPQSRSITENRLQHVSLQRHQPHGPSPPDDSNQTSSSQHHILKEEVTDEGPVSPPPQTETVPLVGVDQLQRKAVPPLALPRAETRKTGTCYFCKKAFMKNKQLMNHVCPKKPKGSNSHLATSPTIPPIVSALALLTRK